ncbi:hypothetical protein B0G52_13322 [Cohnella sp. SGD-V74]|jgi:hypothetical protein|nr:hypothetical protein B0G52_13322 [Cohnella sp. SGD-V74]
MTEFVAKATVGQKMNNNRSEGGMGRWHSKD